MKTKIIPFLLMTAFTISAQTNYKSVEAVNTSSPIIDGIFNESEWTEGGMATGLVQREPNDGLPMSQKTEAYFLYDENNLYVGIKLYDDPDLIMSEIGGRDNYGAADYIGLMLDTFHDHRNSYFFALSTSGTMVDGKCYDDDNASTEWDGIWYGEASITDYGWCAEFQIPFNSLKFDESIDTWGLNIYRGIRRNLEHGYWQYQNREIRFKISESGHLTGLKNIKTGLNFEVTPYITSRLVEDRNNDLNINNRNGIAGVDVKYGVTPNLSAILTINPDFAQIEADEDQINLERYPLYLAEKRPFFTEGFDIFNTAGNNNMNKIFYSRRINEPVYGLKSTGKIGSWDIGLVHALNDNDFGVTRRVNLGELDASVKRSAFYTVLRVSRDIFDKSKFGLIAAGKEYEKGYTRLVGLDGTLRLTSSLNLVFEGVKSFNDDSHQSSHSATAVLFKRGDFLSFASRYNERAANFKGNEIGYYDYSNKRSLGGWFQIAPMLERYGIRQISNLFIYMLENFHNKNFFDNSTMTRYVSGRILVQTMNYWQINAQYYYGKSFDRYDEKLYDVNEWEFSLRNNLFSDLFFQIDHSQGKYFGGYSKSYSGQVEVRPSDNFRFVFKYNRSSIELTDQNSLDPIKITYEILLSKMYYYFNRDLNVRLILQYNKYYDRLDSSFLIAYRFLPGCSFYLAYNELYNSESYTNNIGQVVNPKFSIANRLLQLKFSYLFQI